MSFNRKAALAYALFALIVIAVAGNRIRQYYMPIFKVGQCISLDNEREPWEKPAGIYRIEQIGSRAYRLRSYDFEDKKFYNFDDTQSFVFNNIYHKVPCP